MEWVIKKFSDAPLAIIDGDRGTNYPKKSDFYENGYCLFLNAGNVTSKGLNFSDCVFIDEERDKVLRKGKLDRFDVILTTRGTVGRVGYYDDGIRFDHMRINSGMVIIRTKTDELLPHYLYLYLRSTFFKKQVDGLVTGSAQPQLPIRDINRIDIPIPPLSEQKAIASVLGALDDKIENNRKMNETLEKMARTIFKSWFVDFDPVHAKAAGNPPAHMNADTAALFPSSFGDDGLPVGWIKKPLDKVADFLNGAAMQKFPAEDADFLPVIKIAELRNGISSNTNRASPNVPEKYIISDGDILFAWSGSLMQKVWTEGEGALNQHLFKVTSEEYEGWFFYHWVDHHMKWFQSIAASKATTMGHIQKKHLTEAQVVVPDQSVMQSGSKTIGPLLEKQIRNSIENQTLTKLRDTLLPKLMSGEIRVADAEREMKATT